MPPWFVETVSLRARRRAGRVDDVKALGGARRVVADTDGVWIVSFLDQEQNVDAQISSDLENIVQLVVQRPDVETAKVHTPGSCDVVALSTDSRQSSLTRCTSDRLTGDGERFNWRSAGVNMPSRSTVKSVVMRERSSFIAAAVPGTENIVHVLF